MVFVMWKNRYEAFVKKFGTVNFRTLGQAMEEPEGWGKIAGRPEWGFFKFGAHDPNKSNSGLQTLVLMAYEFAGKQRGLTVGDITEQRFQNWLQSVRARDHPARQLPEPQHRHADGGDGGARPVAVRLRDRLREPGHRLHGGRNQALGRARANSTSPTPTRTPGTSTRITSSTSPGATTGSGRPPRTS